MKPKTKKPGTALELTRKHVQRWAKHPSIITAELARKDTPSKRELLWVYRSVVWFVLAIIAMAVSTVILTLDWTGDGEMTVVWLASLLVEIAAAYMITHHMFIGIDDPLNIDSKVKGLSWTGRKRLVLLHRNRARMPWHRKRVSRLKEGDGRYAHTSVWMEPMGKGIRFSIIEHRPPTDLMMRIYQGRVWRAGFWYQNGEPATEFMKIGNPLQEAEAIVDKRDEYEQLAERVEETAYQNAIATDHLTATVFGFRR